MDPSQQSITDRLAIALLSATFGLVTATLIWVAVAISTNEMALRAPAFLFASLSFGVAGFVLCTAMADAIAAWVQALWAVANGLSNSFDADLGEKPPLWAICFLGVVVAVTVWLSLA